MESRASKFVPVAAALVIAAQFAWFAGAGLRSYFSPDDVMNLYRAWSQPAWKLVGANLLYCSGAFRPMGGLFYATLFALFGFNPLPFRIACFVILLLNLLLVYAFTRRLTSSREVAALTVLVFCYHPYLFSLYTDTGTVYDLLCLCFYCAAFIYYLRIRQSGRYLGWRELSAFAAIYLCALNSKEMAVSLPVLVGVYELWHHPPRSFRWADLQPWLAREGRGAWVVGLLTLPYVIGKTQAGPMVGIPAYRPVFSLTVFMDQWADFLQQIFQDTQRFNTPGVVLLWLLLLVIAWRLKIPALRFCWIYIIVSMLPIIFLPFHRSGFVLYIPMVGWAVYVATLLATARQRVVEWLARRSGGRRRAPAWGPVRPSQVVLFLGTAAALLPARGQIAPDSRWVPEVQLQVRSLIEPLSRWRPVLPRGSRILFLDDFLPPDDWTFSSALRLYYRDDSLRVDRLKQLGKRPEEVALASYDHVLTFDKLRLIQVKPAP